MRSIARLVIHCSATPNGQPVTAADIDRWHAARGLSRADHWAKSWQVHLPYIGYHWVIELDGGLINGRYLEETGAHASGHDADSLGLCLVGTDRYSNAQWRTLASKVAELRRWYPALAVLGHHELSRDSACPGFNVAEWLRCGMLPSAANRLVKVRR